MHSFEFFSIDVFKKEKRKKKAYFYVANLAGTQENKTEQNEIK